MAALPAATATERVAVLSDVHGNLTAYRAVLEDAAARGADRVVNLGDVVGKGPRGSACVALTRERCETTVSGNWEVVLTDRSRTLAHPAMRWWRDELSEADRAWLRDLPLAHHGTWSGRRVRFVHASTDSVFTRVWREHSAAERESFFAATPLTGPGPEPDVAVYGDLHHAYAEVVEGRTLVCCGSAGNPLDGDVAASYLLLEGVPGAPAPAPLGLSLVRVPYDVEAEVAAAAAVGMPQLEEYAVELRTGVYRSLHVARGLRPPR